MVIENNSDFVLFLGLQQTEEGRDPVHQVTAGQDQDLETGKGKQDQNQGIKREGQRGQDQGRGQEILWRRKGSLDPGQYQDRETEEGQGLDQGIENAVILVCKS